MVFDAKQQVKGSECMARPNHLGPQRGNSIVGLWLTACSRERGEKSDKPPELPEYCSSAWH